MASGINEFMVLSRSCRNFRPRGPRWGAYFGGKPDLCHRDLVCPRFVRAVLADHLRQGSRLDTRANTSHELEVVVQVVDGVESSAEDLVAAVEMPQIGAR